MAQGHDLWPTHSCPHISKLFNISVERCTINMQTNKIYCNCVMTLDKLWVDDGDISSCRNRLHIFPVLFVLVFLGIERFNWFYVNICMVFV